MRKEKTKMGKVMEYSFMKFEIQLRLEYFDHMEAHFEKELKIVQEKYAKFKKAVESRTHNFTDQGISQEEDNIGNDNYMIEDYFRKNFRDSQIIQIFSFAEIELIRVCDKYSKRYKTAYNVNDLQGQNEIDRIKKFLIKSANIPISAFNSEWQFLDNLRLIRNQIVHHNGLIWDNSTAKSIDKRFKKIQDFSKDNFTLKKYPYIKSSNEYEIILDKKDFIPLIIEQVISLFAKIAEYETD